MSAVKSMRMIPGIIPQTDCQTETQLASGLRTRCQSRPNPNPNPSLSQRLKRLKQSWCRPDATEPGAGPEEFKRECTMDQATAETPAVIGQVREATTKPDNHSQQPTACGGSSAAVLTPSRRVQAHGRDSSRRKASGKTGLAKLVRQLERTAGRVQQKQG
ncbi:hypothetical protein BOX15_Mlig003162g3 [Macrostomum lignano]|uniref:Uncharacterized protein n=2 Tax=Macrostomum lignano TaxID=282301 RepID=A0A267DQ52_9PLAT|nr:hypothetical protein BOX15_Mlig003162g3 [Macrostomum lignano]